MNKRQLPGVAEWTTSGRVATFALAAASIWCLLAEMYGLCDMRTFALFILVPATVALYGVALLNRLGGDRRLWRAILIGSMAGLAGRWCTMFFVFHRFFRANGGSHPSCPRCRCSRCSPASGH